MRKQLFAVEVGMELAATARCIVADTGRVVHNPQDKLRGNRNNRAVLSDCVDSAIVTSAAGRANGGVVSFDLNDLLRTYSDRAIAQSLGDADMREVNVQPTTRSVDCKGLR